MRINFYEEFPTKENLRALKFIDFPTKIVVAAPNIKKFFVLKERIKTNMYVTDVIYWPLLKKEEGTWLSPFSSTIALNRVVKELKQNKGEITVMWDAELPFLKKALFLKYLLKFRKNKKVILDFFDYASKNGIKIITSQYPTDYLKKFQYFLALNFDHSKYCSETIRMVYSSFLKEKDFEKQIAKTKYAGIGCIAPGQMGNESIISAKRLEHDLEKAKNNGVEEVYIYRLGGLDRKYMKVISGFV